MKTLCWLVLFAGPCAVAQSNNDATLQALLVEVRQLRLALERSAVLTPKIQMTLQRMQFQQEALGRVSRELESVRSQLSSTAGEEAKAGTFISDLENRILQEQDAARRKQLETELKIAKSATEQQSATATQLRAREAELAGRLATEQAKWDELNDRLNAIERALDAPPPKQP